MDVLFVLRDGEPLKEISVVGGQLQAHIDSCPVDPPNNSEPRKP